MKTKVYQVRECEKYRYSIRLNFSFDSSVIARIKRLPVKERFLTMN